MRSRGDEGMRMRGEAHEPVRQTGGCPVARSCLNLLQQLFPLHSLYSLLPFSFPSLLASRRDSRATSASALFARKYIKHGVRREPVLSPPRDVCPSFPSPREGNSCLSSQSGRHIAYHWSARGEARDRETDTRRSSDKTDRQTEGKRVRSERGRSACVVQQLSAVLSGPASIDRQSCPPPVLDRLPVIRSSSRHDRSEQNTWR